MAFAMAASALALQRTGSLALEGGKVQLPKLNSKQQGEKISSQIDEWCQQAQTCN